MQEDKMEQRVQRIPFFTLPNGTAIIVEGTGDADGQAAETEDAQVAILAQYPNGDVTLLCYVDYEAYYGKLSVLAFDGTSEEPAYECSNFRFD